jgi:hypothetical protein
MPLFVYIALTADYLSDVYSVGSFSRLSWVVVKGDNQGLQAVTCFVIFCRCGWIAIRS